MTRLRVHSFTISIDGYGAGPGQNLENPLGVGGITLHEWAFATRTFQKMFGSDGGTTGVDDDFAARGFTNIGAWIMGRNMFGPIRGAWPDDQWKGWWGEDPPYHVPVFVLSHHSRASIAMAGGTTFHFVTDGIENALTKSAGIGARARCAARRRCRDHSTIPSRGPHRRDAANHCADTPRLRRTFVRGSGHRGARLSLQRAYLHGECHACRTHAMTAGIPQCGIAAATIDLTKSRSPISCFSPFP
jgi:dihydrofolate reductase